jgi:hypothetical protein
MKTRTSLALVMSLVTVLGVGCESTTDGTAAPSATAPIAQGPTTSFLLKIENVGKAYPFLKSGVFNTPVGAADPSPAGPGMKYAFTFTAPPGSKLSFATMFVPSNDFFFAPGEEGIALYDESGAPISGDVTSQVKLWDAGTEANQQLGEGSDQPQRQAAANTGPLDPDPTVRPAVDGFGTLPSVASVLKVMIEPGADSSFTVTLQNVSTGSTLPVTGGAQSVPFSPGVWMVHTAPGPLFTEGQPDRGKGLAALAEDGDPRALAATLPADTGVTAPLSPGAWATSESSDAIFTSGELDRGHGLEALAEDGSPRVLAASLASQARVVASGAFDTPAGATMPGVAGPGTAYEVVIKGRPGDALSFATMFVQSNDVFLAPPASGIPLFNGLTPFSGDITSQLQLWDAGTEVNEEPGVGSNQGPRQSAANTGKAEHNVVAPLASSKDGFTYPDVASFVRVTLSPL